MGEALIRAFLAAGICTPDSMVASLRNADRRLVLEEMGIQTVGDAVFADGAAEVASQSDIIFLAVSVRLIKGCAQGCVAPGDMCLEAAQVH